MLTYQVRRRVFHHEPGSDLRCPAPCVLRFHFAPEQPFGVSATGGHTTVRAKPATAYFDANTGQHFVVSAEPLTPLDVTIEEPGRLLQLRGTTLEIHQEFAKIEDVEDLVRSLYFGLPPVLNVCFADPPVVVRVEGEIGDAPIRWELADWRMEFETTTQQKQEHAFASAWERMGLLTGLHRRRLLAALNYFYVAVRLNRSSSAPGEFMAEVVLNLSKVLEVLFPPRVDGKTRDAVRVGLTTLGYASTEIEGSFLPAMALRNEIDVGHVSLALLTGPQLSLIHAYTERAERAFREMLDRTLNAVAAGKWDVEALTDTKPSSRVLAIIERLAAHCGPEAP